VGELAAPWRSKRSIDLCGTTPRDVDFRVFRFKWLAFTKTCWFCVVKNLFLVPLLVCVVVSLMQPNFVPVLEFVIIGLILSLDRWSRIFYPLSKKNYQLIKTLADPNGPLMTPFPRMCLAGWAKYLAMLCRELRTFVTGNHTRIYRCFAHFDLPLFTPHTGLDAVTTPLIIF
jgi:hypothetical protein